MSGLGVYVRVRLCCCGMLAGLLLPGSMGAAGQARSTATQTLRLSAFGGINGTYTGLESGRNVGITAGADLGFRPFFGLRPSVEVRGTYPIHDDGVDSQRNVLAGGKIERAFGRLRPYGDVLFGRGAIDYPHGFEDPTGAVTYSRTVSSVPALGGGLDFDLTPHFAVKADVQVERYVTPVTVSGDVYAKSGTLGVVYRFDFNHHPRGLRRN
ncbi:outer membrane protein [Granulicella arctica]|uniref:outer membrane protein n=1 Tax=Granulicella arctica TaxID=940613 RepID=UPI0021DF8A6D|nr:porin family protein [Granulicella arctica]